MLGILKYPTTGYTGNGFMECAATADSHSILSGGQRGWIRRRGSPRSQPLLICL